jgi:microcystin-dependent protein
MTTPYVGEIRLFGFPRVPTGWLACDGSMQSIDQYQTLYTLLGTTFGGNGVNTFGLPDMRGRVPLHQGTGTGLTPRVMGQLIGTETVTVNSPQMPAHTHAVYATVNPASTATPGTSVMPGSLTGTDTMYASDLTGANVFTLAANAVGLQGGSQPHENTMPTLTVAYCIAYAGIFPSQG